MSKVAMVGTFKCLAGKNDEMDVALKAFVAAAVEMQGIEIYSYLRGEDDNYGFFALFTNQEALEHQGDSAAMKEAMGLFGPLMAGPPNMVVVSPLAAHGFEI